MQKLRSSRHGNINEFQALFHSPGRHFSENKKLRYGTCIQKNLKSSRAQSFSQQRLLEMIHLYASLPCNKKTKTKKKQLPYDQNVVISPRENCTRSSGPLNPYTWTEAAEIAISQGRQCSTMNPEIMSHGYIAGSDQWRWRCNKKKPAVCAYIHTQMYYFFLPIYSIFYVCLYKHTPRSAVGSDVLLLCTPACDSWLDFSPPENLFFWLHLITR